MDKFDADPLERLRAGPGRPRQPAPSRPPISGCRARRRPAARSKPFPRCSTSAAATPRPSRRRPPCATSSCWARCCGRPAAGWRKRLLALVFDSAATPLAYGVREPCRHRRRAPADLPVRRLPGRPAARAGVADRLLGGGRPAALRAGRDRALGRGPGPGGQRRPLRGPHLHRPPRRVPGRRPAERRSPSAFPRQQRGLPRGAGRQRFAGLTGIRARTAPEDLMKENHPLKKQSFVARFAAFLLASPTACLLAAALLAAPGAAAEPAARYDHQNRNGRQLLLRADGDRAGGRPLPASRCSTVPARPATPSTWSKRRRSAARALAGRAAQGRRPGEPGRAGGGLASLPVAGWRARLLLRRGEPRSRARRHLQPPAARPASCRGTSCLGGLLGPARRPHHPARRRAHQAERLLRRRGHGGGDRHRGRRHSIPCSRARCCPATTCFDPSRHRLGVVEPRPFGAGDRRAFGAGHRRAVGAGGDGRRRPARWPPAAVAPVLGEDAIVAFEETGLPPYLRPRHHGRRPDPDGGAGRPDPADPRLRRQRHRQRLRHRAGDPPGPPTRASR